jgi:hypothetical protein
LQGGEPAGLVVEVAEIIVREADQPNAVVSLLDADGLAGEHLTEIDLWLLKQMRPQVVTVAALS